MPLSGEYFDVLESPEEIKKFDYTRDPLRGKYGLSWHGKTPECRSCDIEESILGIGFETLDRDTFNPDDVYGYLAESGAKWVRCQTGWLKCERQKGKYDFVWLENIVDNLRAIGIQPWFSVSFGNPLYTPVKEFDDFIKRNPDKKPPGDIRGYVGEVPLYHGDQAVKGWLDYLNAISKKFKDKVTHWEIWNEPDHINRFWRHQGKAPYPEINNDSLRLMKCAADYVELVKISAAEIKKVIPRAKIIGTTASLTPNDYHRGLKENRIGEHIDIFASHYYGANPEFCTREKWDCLRALIDVPERQIEYWMGESGRQTEKISYNTPYPTEYNQAKYLTRRFVVDLNCGLKISSYFTASDLEKYYTDGADQHYGLIHRIEKRPKLAFSAYKAMAWLFDGLVKADDLYVCVAPVHDAQFCSGLHLNLYTAAFRRKGIPVFCAYIPESIDISAPPVTGQIILSTSPDDHMAEPVVIDPLRGNVYRINHMTKPSWGRGCHVINPFTFSDYPLFITDISVLPEPSAL